MNTGIYTVIPTFFNKDESLNLEMIEIHLLEQRKMGYNNFVFLGTTSETPTLSVEEMKSIISKAYQIKRLNVDNYVFGIGGNDPKKVKDVINELNLTYYNDVIMLSSPYYNKPSQKGIIKYFTEILTFYPNQKFMLYNIPSRTGVNIEVNTFKIIKALNQNFIAVKEASGSIKQMMDLVYALPEVQVFSGDDKLALPGYSVGTVGTVSVASNITPLVKDLYSSFTNGNCLISKRINSHLNNLNDMLFIDSNPVPLKYLLSLKYGNDEYYNVRSPLIKTDGTNHLKLKNIYQTILVDNSKFILTFKSV